MTPRLFLFIACSLYAGFSAAQATAPLERQGETSVTLTLAQLKDSALANNRTLRQKRLAIDAAGQQRREAFTKYFPTVSATGAWFNANRGMAKMDIDPSQFISPELGATLAQMLPAEALMALSSPMTMTMMKNGTIAGISAVQPVFAGGQIVLGNKLAKVGEEASRLQLQLSENEVEAQVEQYYWQLVALQEKRRTLDAADTLLADLAKDAKAAVDAGVALQNDLLQVQLRQNDLQSQRLKLDNGSELISLLLAQACGLSRTPLISFPATAEALTTAPSCEGGEPYGLPEYQLLQKNVEAASLQRKMEVAKNLPSVAVGAGYNYHNLLDNARTFAMLFATVSVPISDWWGGSHAIKRRNSSTRTPNC